jgi:carbonic anhydrase
VIARSSVNVNHGGQTGWSNFFAGALLLVFVLFLSPVIQEIPLAALAGILVYTGYKLTAPHVVKDTLHKGPDHFLVFFVTVAATLVYGLLWGIAIGLAAELVMQLVTLGQPPLEGLRRIWQTRVERRHEEGEPHLLQIRGVANYLNIPRLRRAFAEVPSDESIIVDFGGCELVDNTVLEYTHDVCRRHQDGDLGRFAVVGLERLRAVSDHPDALHALDRGLQTLRLTGRQKLIAELAASHGGPSRAPGGGRRGSSSASPSSASTPWSTPRPESRVASTRPGGASAGPWRTSPSTRAPSSRRSTRPPRSR